ncbi:hypothetical protein [Micromonospora sp. WMMD736]|uniref:hypothetical protein n=1 Tax=Micromonospora sp. WMMD736 TaxID=3404112 RepID=UPI003B946296
MSATWRWASPARGPAGYSCNRLQKHLWTAAFNHDPDEPLDEATEQLLVAMHPAEIVLQVLRRTLDLRSELQMETAALVFEARKLGGSWGEIGRFAWVTAQGAQKRYGSGLAGKALERIRKIGWQLPPEDFRRWDDYCKTPAQRMVILEAFLGEPSNIDDYAPLERVFLLVEGAQEVLRQLGYEAEGLVTDARYRGATWAGVGESLAISPQGAQKKFMHGISPEAVKYLDHEISATALMRRAIINMNVKYDLTEEIDKTWEGFLREQRLLDLTAVGRMPRSENGSRG